MTNDELLKYLRERFPHHVWEWDGEFFSGESEDYWTIEVSRVEWGYYVTVTADRSKSVGWGRKIKEAIASCSNEAAEIVEVLSE